jgi:hypothetical protein
VTDPRPLTEILDNSFAEWWHEYIDEVAPAVAEKARNYGTNSLEQIGSLIPTARGDRADLPTSLEIGCFVYAYGKMQRVADAVLRGDSPAEDSWHDLMVYCAMALYIRHERRWP